MSVSTHDSSADVNRERTSQHAVNHEAYRQELFYSLFLPLIVCLLLVEVGAAGVKKTNAENFFSACFSELLILFLECKKKREWEDLIHHIIALDGS